MTFVYVVYRTVLGCKVKVGNYPTMPEAEEVAQKILGVDGAGGITNRCLTPQPADREQTIYACSEKGSESQGPYAWVEVASIETVGIKKPFKKNLPFKPRM